MPHVEWIRVKTMFEVGLSKPSCFPSAQPSQEGLELILLIIDTDGGVEGIRT